MPSQEQPSNLPSHSSSTAHSAIRDSWNFACLVNPSYNHFSLAYSTFCFIYSEIASPAYSFISSHDLLMNFMLNLIYLSFFLRTLSNAFRNPLSTSLMFSRQWGTMAISLVIVIRKYENAKHLANWLVKKKKSHSNWAKVQPQAQQTFNVIDLVQNEHATNLGYKKDV